MKINNTKNEQISAFADGEIDIEHVDALMREFRHEPHLHTWEAYHQIGDTLRSDDMGQNCSANFSAKLMARLATEPAYLSSNSFEHLAGNTRQFSDSLGSRPSRLRFIRSSRVMSGIAASAAVLYFGGSYLIQSTSDSKSLNELTAWAKSQPNLAAPLTKTAQTVSGNQVVVMRDPQIDAYLIAHQQFSPSLFSTTQYARAASFTNESAK